MSALWGGKVDFEKARLEMVRRDLAGRDITDKRVLDAFGRVPRERFVWDVDSGDAYADHPLRIGCGQTISQPYMVALMTQALGLKGDELVLEVGTGSGYQAAILAELAREIHTIERFGELSERARGVLEELGYENLRFHVGDGTLGLPEEAPFDGIMVTAGAPKVPEPLKKQLKDGGRLAVPVGGAHEQDLLVVKRRGDEYETENVCPCIFVKLVGEEGWAE